MTRLTDHLLRQWTLRTLALRSREQGDVPGWVLITVMTAGLVTALWIVAKPALQGIFTDAVSSVKGP